MTAGPAAGPDRARRWVAAVASGATFAALALVAPLTAALVTLADPVLVQATAGLALTGAFTAAASDALHGRRTGSRPAARCW